MSDRPPSPANAAETILFLLIPDFSMIAFTSAIEPLRIANRLSGRRLYEWRLLSRDGAPVSASNGIAIQVGGAVADTEPPGSGVLPAVVLCGGLGSEHYPFCQLDRMRGSSISKLSKPHCSRNCRWSAITGPTARISPAKP